MIWSGGARSLLWIFAFKTEGEGSLHRTSWPVADEMMESDEAEATGEVLVTIATAVRRYKSERNLSVGAALKRLQLATKEPVVVKMLREAEEDLMSVTRAQRVEIVDRLDSEMETLLSEGSIAVGIVREEK
jgi:valyl-tRNA synthetase